MKEDYYSLHAKEYEEETIRLDRKETYSFLTPYLPKGKLSVLDVGFGSGRDRMYFLSLGYDVEGIDTSLPFVLDGRKRGLTCYKADRKSFIPSHPYDLIFALASLHHLKREEIYPVISRLFSYLKEDGILFLSWKYGKKEDGYDQRGRYFTYLSDEDINGFPYRIKARRKTSSSLRKEDTFIDRILTEKDNKKRPF